MKSQLPLASLLALLVFSVFFSDNTAISMEGTEGLPQSEADLRAPHAPMTPVISKRTYLSGSAIVKVTGSFQADAEVPINTQASTSDGEMTWLQYGASGAETPNSLVTISPSEVGLSIGLGKKTALAEANECNGSMNVTDTLVSGSYKCVDAASHDPGEISNFGVGKADIEIRFTAGS